MVTDDGQMAEATDKMRTCGSADFLDLKMTKPNYKPNTGPNSNPLVLNSMAGHKYIEPFQRYAYST